MPRKFSIGRERTCDFFIADESVSRLHAEIWLADDGTLMVADRGSSNGTQLVRNGQSTPLFEERLMITDEVRFGAASFPVRDVVDAIEGKNPGALTPKASAPPPPPLPPSMPKSGVSAAPPAAPVPPPMTPSTPPPPPPMEASKPAAPPPPPSGSGGPPSMRSGPPGHNPLLPAAPPKGGVDPVVGWLVCIEGPDRGRDYRLRSGMNALGRSPAMDVCIASDAAVSRERHCSITFEADKESFLLAPGDAGNFLYLNGDLVTAPRHLKPDDVMDVGRTKLVFVPFWSKEHRWF